MCLHAILPKCATHRSTTYTHHFPDKQAGHNGEKLIVIHQQTNPLYFKVTDSGVTTRR